MRGRIFGVVGIGRIGTATALRAKSHGLDVVFYDPYVPNGYEKALGVRRVDTLEQLLSKSDFVSLHTPLTPETLHSLDRPQFAAMKPGAFLINTARGKIVNIEALEEALASGRLGGAALDVLENEPAGLEIAKRYQNCIVTPHSAFYSQESMVEMRTTAARIVRDALLNGKLDNLVNNVTARVSEVQLS